MGQDTESTFQPADNLRSRTFIGLLIAQFLAAFNDQAIHASAMFFAINHNTMSEANAITIMPVLFYAPWALFSTYAGYLADKYSKRSIIVFWKLAEVAIMGLALVGFLLPHLHAFAWLSPQALAVSPTTWSGVTSTFRWVSPARTSLQVAAELSETLRTRRC